MVLGRGAFGTVVFGRWRGRKVAVKVMEAEVGGTTAKRRKSLESELTTGSKAGSPECGEGVRSACSGARTRCGDYGVCWQ